MGGGNDKNKALIQYLEGQLASLQEPENQEQAQDEEAGFSQFQGALELGRSVGRLEARVDDLPTKSWVWRVLLAIVGIGVLALGALGTWLRTFLDLLRATLPG